MCLPSLRSTLIIVLITRILSFRLRQVDVKAEHFERQVQRVEQERDQWERKYEVRELTPEALSPQCLTLDAGGRREVPSVQGRARRARVQHGGSLSARHIPHSDQCISPRIRRFSSCFAALFTLLKLPSKPRIGVRMGLVESVSRHDYDYTIVCYTDGFAFDQMKDMLLEWVSRRPVRHG